jgi:hypothetical protein
MTLANDTLGSLLKAQGVTGRVIIPPGIRSLLDSLAVVSTAPPLVQAGTAQTLLGFASLNLEPFGPKADFTLVFTPTGGFRIDLTYLDAFRLPASLPGATVVQAGAEKHLQRIAPDRRVQLINALALRIEGEPGAPAGQRIVFPGAAGALVPLQCDPPAFLWGDSGFGLHLPDGLVVDDSATLAPDPPQHAAFPFASQDPAWRGISIRNAELYLPESTPLIGGSPIPVDLEIGSPVGMDARTQVVIPASGSRPEIAATVEWHDPAAVTLAAPPTSVELAAKWQIDGSETTFGGAPVRLAGGRPLLVRGRYTRDPRDGQMKFNLAVEGGGDDGLVSVTAGPGDTVPKIFVTAAALATAIMADSQVNPDPTRDASGTALHLLLTAATALSSALTQSGKVVVHGVEVEGSVAIASAPLRLRVDYSVDVVVKPIVLGALSICMRDDVPMRIRYRNVLLQVDLSKSGLERFHVSFAGCSTLVEDPGGWLVQSPGSLLDIIGTRSGHGSSWFEVDLRFALDLGPVKVSGATLRATVDDNNPLAAPDVSLRGLAVEVKVPGVLTGRGQGVVTPAGFDANLAVTLDALNIGAFGFLGLRGPQVLVDVGVDLPGPIPFANSGLGLFGIGGLFGLNAALPALNPAGDPVEQQLKWNPHDPAQLPVRPGAFVMGLGAVVGTVPDLGFAFSTKAMIVVAAPDVTVRAALTAKFISAKRASIGDTGDAAPGELRVLGLLVVNPDAVALALRGQYIIPVLLDVEMPVSAYYPYGKSDWFLHVGSDGQNGRGPGPIRATVLPDLVSIGGYAFLMLRGNGIPNLGGTGMNLGGFAIGMGFGFDIVYPMGIVWLEMGAQAVIGIASDPFMFIGKGGLQGTLHLGPFSLGVSADVKFQVGPEDARVLWLKVCGEVDLWFTTLRGCVEVGTDNIQDSVPDPQQPVLHRIGLTDWHGREVAAAAPGGPDNPPADVPVVWPDALPVLEFVTGPKQTGSAGLLSRIHKAFMGTGDAGADELRYTYALSKLALEEFRPATHDWADAALQPTPFWGAWQVPKQGGSQQMPGARQLVLLSGELHHWVRNLNDGGEGEPDDPIGAIGRLCRPTVAAVRGWALGKSAEQGATAARWHLPSDGSVLDPLYSCFEVDLGVTWLEELELEPFAVHPELALDPLHPAGSTIFPQPFSGGGRTFNGALMLPHVDSPDRHRRFEPTVTASLTFTDTLTGVEVYLLVPEELAPEDAASLVGHVPGPGGVTEAISPRETLPAPPGFVLAVYGDPNRGVYDGVDVRYQLQAAVQLVGVSGLAVAARKQANEASTRLAQGAIGQAQMAARPPGGRKPMLKANTLYRITATIDRTGQRKNQPVQPLPAQESTYYFRTAPFTQAPQHPSAIGRLELIRRVDTFDPAYLARYIAGWTPGEKTAAWFLDDPVLVHFDVDHIAAMVDAYDHEVVLRAFRTDTPPGAPDSGHEFFKDSLGPLVALALAKKADQRLFAKGLELAAVSAVCRQPTPGASLGGTLPLAPNAQYDLAVTFPEKGSGLRPNQIPGIHFGTSRYAGAAGLLQAVGFGAGGHVAGDVPVRDVALDGADGDRAVEDALDRLGLGPWPATVDARATALWLKVQDQWRLRGVLLEAPEAIERFDPAANRFRLKLDGLRCAGQPFEIVRRNASASRVLYLTAQPLAPAAPLELLGHENRPMDPPGAAAAAFALQAAVAAVPAFVEDLA